MSQSGLTEHLLLAVCPRVHRKSLGISIEEETTGIGTEVTGRGRQQGVESCGGAKNDTEPP